MRPGRSFAFLVTFVVVYLAISWLDTGSIYWTGLIGATAGAALAFLVLGAWRHDRRKRTGDE